MTNTQRTFDSLRWCNSPAYCEDALWWELTAARPKCAYVYGTRYCFYRDAPILTEEQRAAGLYIVTGRKPHSTIELWHKSTCIDAREASQIGLIKEAAAKWMLAEKAIQGTKRIIDEGHAKTTCGPICDRCILWPKDCTGRMGPGGCKDYSPKPTEPKMAKVCQGCRKWVKNHCAAGWLPAAEWNYCHNYSTKPPPAAPVPDYAADKAEIVKALKALRYNTDDWRQAIAALEGKEARHD